MSTQLRLSVVTHCTGSTHVQLAVWSTTGSVLAVVVDYQLYYMDTLHRDIMVKVGSQVAEGDRGVSREGVADLMYQGN